jgi:hypothetical protein
VFDAC